MSPRAWTAYPEAERVFADAEANLELARELFARCRPLSKGGPAWRYLEEHRGLRDEAIVGAGDDLRELEPLIPGRAAHEYALVSVLRDARGEPSGFQLTFCDVEGRPAAGDTDRPRRQTYALRRHGIRDGLFRVTAAPGVVSLAGCVLVEGYAEKAIAAYEALAGPGGRLPVYGWGALTVLGHALPPEKSLIVLPDRPPADEEPAAGHAAAMRRGLDRLILAGRRVRLAPPPRCEHADGTNCKDADDYLRAHGAAELARLIGRAEPAELSPAGETAQLATIKSPIERARAAKELARRLKVPVAAVRDELKGIERSARGEAAADEDEDGAGSALDFAEVHPAAEPQDGAALFDAMAGAIRRHARISETEITAAILWTVHGHRRFHDNIGVLPRLVVTAGREDSGKTHLALTLFHMTERALHTVSPRPASVYRAIEAGQCALFLDEVDNWYARDADMAEIINSGFNRDGALVVRVEDVGTGSRRNLQPRLFSTFTPMALVGIELEKVLARTVLSRAIVIRMRPALAGDEVEDLYDNPKAVAKLKTLAGRVKRWIADRETELVNHAPTKPEGARNRLWIVWRPLLALAELAGGDDWPRRALLAFQEARERGGDAGLGVQLLGDMHAILSALAETTDPKTGRPIGRRLHTKDIIARLLELEMRTWAFFGRSRSAIRDVDVAALLRPYEVEPVQMKIGGLNRRGYQLADIERAIERYAPQILVDARGESGDEADIPPEALYPATDDELDNTINDLVLRHRDHAG